MLVVPAVKLLAQTKADIETRKVTEDTVRLSPFEVPADRDVGWVAAGTLSGSRTNELLSNLPISVDALTSEFIKDLNVYTLEDAGMFVAGLDVINRRERATDDQMTAYRGMTTGDRETGQSSRNFFPWFSPTDNFNLERIDFNKGANSLMYGDATPGGLATTYTKTPRFNNFGSVMAQYGSNDSHRFQLDINRKITDKVAARLNLVDRSDRSYINFDASGLRGADASIIYRPFKNTELRVEGEIGKYERTRASNQVTIKALSAPGRGFSTTNRWYFTSDGDIIQRTASTTASPTTPSLTAADFIATGGDTLSLLEGMTQTVALTTRVGSTTVPTGKTVTWRGYDKAMNLQGTNDFLNRPYRNETYWLRQTFGKLNLELSYNQQSEWQNRNDSSFNTQVQLDSNGRPYTDQTSLDSKIFQVRSETVRFSAAYPLEYGRWIKQFVVLTIASEKDDLYSRRYTLGNFAAIANGGLITNNGIAVRAYLDDPGIYGRAFWERFRAERLPRTPTFNPGFYETTDANRPFDDVRYLKTHSLSLNGQYFDGRLRSLIGVRRDQFSRKRITNIPIDATGQAVYLGGPEAVPSAYSYDPQFQGTHTTVQTGLSYALTRSLNLYANYSTSFHFQGFATFTGTPLGPVTGKTKEIGLKGDLLGNKLAYTVAFYRQEKFNTQFVWSNPSGFTDAQLEDLFNPNNLLPGDPSYFHLWTGLNNESHTVPANEVAKGVEATFQLQPMRGVRARLTFTYNVIESAREFTKFKALYDAAVERTNAANAAGGNKAMAEDPAFLANANTILGSNYGAFDVVGSRGKPHSANLVLDYSFSNETKLKGLSLGLTANWQSTYNIAIINGKNYTGDSQFPIGVYASYRRKLMRHDTTFRFGATRIYDLVQGDSDYRHTGLTIRTDGSYNYANKYLEPMSLNFTATVNF